MTIRSLLAAAIIALAPLFAPPADAASIAQATTIVTRTNDTNA